MPGHQIERDYLRAQTDLDRLCSIKALSWLSTQELELLAETLTINEVETPGVLHQSEFASRARILLRGIARITCQSPRGKRITIALLGAGPIPELPAGSRFDFRCEAYDKCRIGTVSWAGLADIVAYGSKFAFEEFHRNDSQQCFKMLLRSSTLLGLNLHDRIAITMLELATNFGIKESRGILLTEQFSHQQIADLVGASRPRISEHLAELEREALPGLVRPLRSTVFATAAAIVFQ